MSRRGQPRRGTSSTEILVEEVLWDVTDGAQVLLTAPANAALSVLSLKAEVIEAIIMDPALEFDDPMLANQFDVKVGGNMAVQVWMVTEGVNGLHNFNGDTESPYRTTIQNMVNPSANLLETSLSADNGHPPVSGTIKFTIQYLEI